MRKFNQTLAVAYRPKNFDEICGQNVVTKILKQMVATKSFKNCLLFAGTSGAGKTTLARCFARAINNGIGEPAEYDCASHGGVEDIRAIVEDATQRSLTGEYKVIILDECHAISTAGWQAFLKCIEEPPTYTVFIFCTTEPNKVPKTILNRVQRYNIAPIAINEIRERLEHICEQEGFNNYKLTCDFLSKICEGSMRTAIAYLEQCADYSVDLSMNNVKAVLGEFSYEVAIDLTNNLVDGNEANVLTIIDNLAASGTDIKQFINFYIGFCIDVVKYILFKSISVTNLPEYLEKASGTTSISYMINIDNACEWFNKLTDMLLVIKSEIKNDISCKNTVEAFFIKICRG